jgi:hypothetical protein
MPTPNLNITHIAAAQNQKEVTANAAFDALDKALTGVLSVDFAAGDVTLTDSQFREHIAFQAFNLVTARTLTAPAIQRLFVVDNTAGSDTLTVIRGNTSIVLGAGANGIFYTDGIADGLVQLGGGTSGSAMVELAGSYAGSPAAGERMFHHVATRAVTLPSGLTNSHGVAKTAATAQTDFDIKKNGSSVGTMRFAASATTATFIMASETSLSAGDQLEIIAPGTPDATLADLAWTLRGTV